MEKTEKMEKDIKLNVCGLEPPEPLELVLDALSGLAKDQRLSLLIDREPFPLYRILGRNGFAHEAQPGPDNFHQILIWHRQ